MACASRRDWLAAIARRAGLTVSAVSAECAVIAGIGVRANGSHYLHHQMWLPEYWPCLPIVYTCDGVQPILCPLSQTGAGQLLASATPAAALWHLGLGKEDVLADDGVKLQAERRM